MDPHHFGKLDPEPHQTESRSQLRIRVKVKSKIPIRTGIEVKIRELWTLKM
jgi:hypothetical protein